MDKIPATTKWKIVWWKRNYYSCLALKKLSKEVTYSSSTTSGTVGIFSLQNWHPPADVKAPWFSFDLVDDRAMVVGAVVLRMATDDEVCAIGQECGGPAWVGWVPKRVHARMYQYASWRFLKSLTPILMYPMAFNILKCHGGFRDQKEWGHPSFAPVLVRSIKANIHNQTF